MDTDRVIVVGFMASGKSSTGRAYARLIGWEFFDSDDEIEGEQGMTPKEIIDEKGIKEFRRLETDMIRRLCERAHVVIAVGGGAFPEPANRDFMREHSVVVWLNLPFEECARRAKRDGDTRPLFKVKSDARNLYLERLKDYQRAHIVITPKGTPAQIAQEIQFRIKQLAAAA